ncbi:MULTISPECIES: response regulator [unclassified Pseudomonas]|uniref:response regulator n=1 Tax=unclassified Pseudomonas TaxID=196821 RepID=UPI000BC84688|nr:MULTISPECIES: response regulator [unclassified Pseudomonas]PVZ19550.1 response regulator receiver domain-containing protein [Pseudomonas sp. URIL14HWK12:I12]PVZ22865.1 response regulator receiver domain-containing protein [Pseudomonas sp. URIL14HWK12:I10]PVZ37505.1 response regulator receiver domain-containing protein [Pseudomonas sp. URIL14HWK12:I11]SNZ14944.1 Response regulator containing CheY-like receiver, AAA-type ATPase, and DNA-binding domains [Pseudomonas sp. URIL14HWK12:I9]
MDYTVRVLLVEDEPVLGELMVDLLQEMNLRVTLAATADQGRQLFCSAPEKWGLVVTDVRTPGHSDGCDLAWDVEQACRRTPLLVCSGFMVDTIDLPPSANVLSKPWSLEAFEARVHTLLSPRRRDDDEQAAGFTSPAMA